MTTSKLTQILELFQKSDDFISIAKETEDYSFRIDNYQNASEMLSKANNLLMKERASHSNLSLSQIFYQAVYEFGLKEREQHLAEVA